jgi:hypothetical protein
VIDYSKEESKLKRVHTVYDRLLNEARAEVEKAVRQWDNLQDDIITVKMVEFAASGDDSLLLTEEKFLLEEMNEKLSAAQAKVDFWRGRLEKLQQYKQNLQSFSARLETDIEIHRLRLSVSRRI